MKANEITAKSQPTNDKPVEENSSNPMNDMLSDYLSQTNGADNLTNQNASAWHSDATKDEVSELNAHTSTGAAKLSIRERIQQITSRVTNNRNKHSVHSSVPSGRKHVYKRSKGNLDTLLHNRTSRNSK